MHFARVSTATMAARSNAKLVLRFSSATEHVYVAREDPAYQSGAQLARTDHDRIRLVLADLCSGRVHSPADLFNVAIVLQHSPLTFRGDTLVAISPDNYRLGHHLAASAFDAGYDSARELVAPSIDRYLSLTTGMQSHGTNRSSIRPTHSHVRCQNQKNSAEMRGFSFAAAFWSSASSGPPWGAVVMSEYDRGRAHLWRAWACARQSRVAHVPSDRTVNCRIVCTPTLRAGDLVSRRLSVPRARGGAVQSRTGGPYRFRRAHWWARRRGARRSPGSKRRGPRARVAAPPCGRARHGWRSPSVCTNDRSAPNRQS